MQSQVLAMLAMRGTTTTLILDNAESLSGLAAMATETGFSEYWSLVMITYTCSCFLSKLYSCSSFIVKDCKDNFSCVTIWQLSEKLVKYFMWSSYRDMNLFLSALLPWGFVIQVLCSAAPQQIVKRNVTHQQVYAFCQSSLVYAKPTFQDTIMIQSLECVKNLFTEDVALMETTLCEYNLI